MRYTEYDYCEATGAEYDGSPKSLWSAHWGDREGLRTDCTSQNVWPAIEDIVSKPGRLLEAGCGVPQWVQFFHQRGFDAVGVDYDEKCLEIGKAANPELELVHADLRKLPFEDERFDYVVSFGAVEHDIEGPEAALAELRRVLAPDGWLLCSVPCLNIALRCSLPWLVVKDWLRRQAIVRKLIGRQEDFVFWQYSWTPKAYTRLLRRMGLNVVELRGYGTRGPSVLRPLARRISTLGCTHMMLAVCKKA